jgi:hypothetical protein
MRYTKGHHQHAALPLMPSRLLHSTQSTQHLKRHCQENNLKHPGCNGTLLTLCIQGSALGSCQAATVGARHDLNGVRPAANPADVVCSGGSSSSSMSSQPSGYCSTRHTAAVQPVCHVLV